MTVIITTYYLINNTIDMVAIILLITVHTCIITVPVNVRYEINTGKNTSYMTTHVHDMICS